MNTVKSTSANAGRNGQKTYALLLVEDRFGDADVVRKALDYNHSFDNLSILNDGEAAMAFLRREGAYADAPRPDMILLDLDLSKKAGREVLAEIKADPSLKRIPVVVLLSPGHEEDVFNSYNLHANCCITRPVDLCHFITVMKSIEDFWLSIVVLPDRL